MTAVYLAASWKQKYLMREYRDFLEASNRIKVTSRWIDTPDHNLGYLPGLAENMHQGIRDLEDINAASHVLVFTDVPSTSGGLHIELGYSLAKGKVISIVGPFTNIFQRQARYQFADWYEFLRYMPL